MPKLPPGQSYSGRPTCTALRQITIDEDTDQVLRLYTGDGKRPIGRFIERLIWEYHGKAQERARLRLAMDQEEARSSP